MKYRKLPRGFREGHCGDVACPHRDLSCCPACAGSDFLVEVYGQHFFAPQGREAAVAEFRAEGATEKEVK